MRSLAVALLLLGAAYASAAPPSEAERLYNEGVKHAAKKQHALAARKFEEAFRHEPNHAYLYNAGASWEWARDFVSAVRVYERFVTFSDSPGRIAEVKDKINVLEARLARTHARVTIEVEPAGALLFIDDVPDPIDAPLVRWLVAGEHAVTAKKADHEPRREAFTIVAGEPKRLRIVLAPIVARGRLMIQAVPPGAKVWIEEKLMGVTPVALVLPIGVYAVRLEAPGFEPLTKEVAIEPGGDLRLALRLVPSRVAPPEPLPIVVPLPQSVSVTRTWWFWTAMGAAVVGGTVLAVVLALPETTTEAPPAPSATWTVGGAP